MKRHRNTIHNLFFKKSDKKVIKAFMKFKKLALQNLITFRIQFSSLVMNV